MGPARTGSMARLLGRVGGIAYPILWDMPGLMDASWTLVGGALPGGPRPRKMQAPSLSPPPQPLSVMVPRSVTDPTPSAPEQE